MALDTQSGSIPPGIFNIFRVNGAPTYYGENLTAVKADLLEAGFIFAGCILAASLFCILPGVHGKSRWFTGLWILIAVFVGTSILVVNYSPEWESAEVLAATKYKAGSGEDIQAHIGIHIGLKGVNITLKGSPVHQLNETINYNEHFGWTWGQGRNFFGPYASQFNQEYRAAQFRGLPLPILWVAEYLTLDGDGIRWGRFYRESGLFAFMCIWLAFAFWIVANIMVFILIRYSAYLMVLTGASLCTANIIKQYLRAPLELAIPFSTEHVLHLHYGPAFWLCLVTGLFCIVCGLVVLVMDLALPSAIAAFFSANILQDEGLFQREESVLSHNSADTDRSDLTHIVEVDGDKVVRKVDVRPVGAPKTGSKTIPCINNREVDDIFGDQQWTDDDSDSDFDLTDEEWEEPQESVQKTITRRARGIVQKFQSRRRVPSAKSKPMPKTTNLAARKPSPRTIKVHPATESSKSTPRRRQTQL